MNAAVHTKVFVVDDAPSVRASLHDLLREIDSVSIVGDAETPETAIAGILQTQPDYVVLDYQLLGGTGVEVLRAVRAQAPGIVFIVLTNHPNPQYRQVCMEAGASFFFDKSMEFDKVKDVIAGSDPTQVSHR